MQCGILLSSIEFSFGITDFELIFIFIFLEKNYFLNPDLTAKICGLADCWLRNEAIENSGKR